MSCEACARLYDWDERCQVMCQSLQGICLFSSSFGFCKEHDQLEHALHMIPPPSASNLNNNVRYKNHVGLI